MSLSVPGINYQSGEAVWSKFVKGWLGGVFLHRYNNPMQMKPKPNPATEPRPTDLK
jgi:hypothetical protein